MMVLSFDPTVASERKRALEIINLYGSTATTSVLSAESEAAIADHTAATTTTTAAAANTVPSTAEGAGYSDITLDPVAGKELDANGTPWIDGIHATTKTKSADDVWKARRNSAANPITPEIIAAAEQKARDELAGTPTPVVPTEPVVPAADIPVEPVTIEMVAAVWQEGVAAGVVTNEAAPALYASLEIDPAQLSVNETMRASLHGHVRGLIDAPAAVAAGIPGLPGA